MTYFELSKPDLNWAAG